MNNGPVPLHVLNTVIMQLYSIKYSYMEDRRSATIHKRSNNVCLLEYYCDLLSSTPTLLNAVS